MRDKREVQHISDVLDAMVSRMGIKTQLKKAEVVTEWPAIIGEQIAEQTKAERIRGTTLFVTASSPVWAQELDFLKPKILKKIRERVGRGVVTDIRFRTGKI